MLAMLLAYPAWAAGPVPWMMQATVRGHRIEGQPLAWNDQEVHLLGRDGRLWQFAPREASNLRRTADRFRPYLPSELRASLLGELGQGYEVSGTGHYMVAHPKGQRDQWAPRFEELYRAFVHYFGVRGFPLQQPPFPLVGIVCADRRQFLEYSEAGGDVAGAGVLGYYCLTSNRIVLYDQSPSSADPVRWQRNAAVVIHEATHQVAFNTGVHSRYCPPPLWLAEGLAALMEAPGVHDPRSFCRLADRIHAQRLADFRRTVLPAHRPELLAELVASDRLFRVAPAAAYAEAWALTFFLTETEPDKFGRYVARTAARPPFADYPATQRTADFVAVFGPDWRMLEARLLRFMGGLP